MSCQLQMSGKWNCDLVFRQRQYIARSLRKPSIYPSGVCSALTRANSGFLHKAPVRCPSGRSSGPVTAVPVHSKGRPVPLVGTKYSHRLPLCRGNSSFSGLSRCNERDNLLPTVANNRKVSGLSCCLSCQEFYRAALRLL
jgi:hypothetical protein